MTPILTNTDRNTIKALLLEAHRASVSKDLDLLLGELEKAKVVTDDEIESDIVRLNSYVEVEDIESKKIMKFRITMPKDADFKQQKISVLSPIGIALIGFKKGMTIQWSLPGGKKKLNILEVKNG